MDRAGVERWLGAYERAWRTEGTAMLPSVFPDDVSYRPSPWGSPFEGIAAVADFWERERKGADEEFVMSSEVVAVDGSVAVVRVSVDYGEPLHSRWRDLWVVEFAADGRCSAFEEWPFAPEQRDGH
ncbi:MAG: nuclear transport factor 2 family protein [Nocardioidaceae bacterium]